MRLSQLIPILEQELASAGEGTHTPVTLWGPPGVGKSRIVAELAQKFSAPMIDLRLSQIEPSDLRGIPYRFEDGVEWAVPRLLPNAERHGERGILFLDEINAAPPSVSATAYQLILDCRLGDYRVPAGWASSPPATARATAACRTSCRRRWPIVSPTTKSRSVWRTG